MTYAINGTALTLQPTSGRWLPRTQLGVDGNGHAIYSAVRQFEMRFQLGTTADYNQLQNFFISVGATGTVIVDLPQYGAATYTFISYTGCTLREPEFNSYFTQHQEDFILLVTNIKT